MPLPVPPNMMRVRFSATLGGAGTSQDEAQWGFYGQRVHQPGNEVTWPLDVQEVAGKILDRWIEHVTIQGLFSTAVKLDTVTVDHLDEANGKTLDQGVAVATGASAWAGTASSSLPWETALAVSLYGYTPGSFTQNKPRKRGRFYLPPMAPSVLSDTSGQVSGAYMNQVLNAFNDFFNDVQGLEIGGGTLGQDNDFFNLVVMSKGTALKPLDPTTTPVIWVQVDSKVDSQRRRERQQDPITTVKAAIAHA